MNLVVDCFKLVKGAGKSIGIYNLAKSIVTHLGEKALREQEGLKHAGQTIIVLGNAYNRKDFDVPGVTFVEMKGNPQNKIYCILWELMLVVRYADKYHADRILFPRGFRPLGGIKSAGIRAGGRSIRDTIIIHDLIPFYYDKYYPGVFNKLENAYIMNRMKASIRRADRVITISDYSKQDILDKVPGCESKITVINNGLNDVSFDRSGEGNQGKNMGGDAGGDRREDTAENGAKKRYIVAMTSALPHKNAKGVLSAYEAYYRQTENPLELLVIGIADSSFYPEMDREAAGHVTFCKFVEKFDELCRMVAEAEAYLFLSYVEGFGFPPLEAMQLGVPVVCSCRSSLPEVVGDAGVLVEPDDLDAVGKALVKVTTDQAFREELIGKGYENIRRFSWDSRTDLYWEELFR